MEEGYEQPPSSNGAGPWWDKGREGTAGEGVLIAFLALAMFVIVGGVMWGLLAVTPLWTQLFGVVCGIPGGIFLARAFAGGARAAAGASTAVGAAWQRLVHGSAMFGGALVITAIVAVIVVTDR